MSTIAQENPIPARERTSGLYVDDFVVGHKYRSAQLTVDAAAIRAFAIDFDPQPFHLDEHAARASFFGGLAASWWHTAALTMRLLVQSELGPAGATSKPSPAAGTETDS